MASPNFTADDLAGALLRLMPRGRVWPRDTSTVQAKVLNGVAASSARVAGRGIDLLTDAFPASSYELLTEWEETLGLPGTCSGLAGSIQARQAQVVSKLIDSGGQSLPYFIAIAEALGYTITITEFKPFSVVSRVNSPLYGPDWAHAWQVNGATNTIINFNVSSTVAEALATWGNNALECVFNQIKPAHTVLIFNYS